MNILIGPAVVITVDGQADVAYKFPVGASHV